MNNTRHIKAITAAALLLLGTGLPYGVAANEGATQVSQQGSVTDTLTTRQQAIPLIASAMASVLPNSDSVTIRAVMVGSP